MQDGHARFVAPTAEDRAMLKQAVAWIHETSPETAERLFGSPWTVYVDDTPTPDLGVTHQPTRETLIHRWTVSVWGEYYGIPTYKTCALVLVHEHTHLEPDGDSEIPAIKATAEFAQTWPAGQDKDRAIAAVLKDLAAVDPNGHWKF